MKNLFLFSFSIIFSFSSFSQEEIFQEEFNLVVSNFSVFIAYDGNKDISNHHRSNDVDLIFTYDSTSQKMIYTNFWKKNSTYSSGELVLVEDPSVFDDHPEGKQFFIWDYFNSYNDVTGVALVIVSKSESIVVNQEKIYVVIVEVILPGGDDLFYEALLDGDNNFFEKVALLE